MDFNRGPRMRGPSFPNYRPRLGGNTVINHPPMHNQLHPPVQPRVFAHSHNMNQPQWNTPTPLNTFPPQDESLNYTQPPYNADVAGYNNYSYRQGLPSTELLNATAPSQGFPPFGQQVFLQQPATMFMDQMCYTQPSITTTPPIVTSVENVSPRKLPFNSKESMFICCNCHHRNGLAESENIKKEEQINGLQKENQALRKQIESFMADSISLQSQIENLVVENATLRSQLVEGNQSERLKESMETQKIVHVEVSERSSKPLNESDNQSSDDTGKQSLLSPNAKEFNPKHKESAEVITPTSNPDVPVVSAKGVMDEERDAPTPILESEAGTQVEENLFEESTQNCMPAVVEIPVAEDSAPSVELPKEPTTTDVQHEEWNEDVDITNTTRTESDHKAKELPKEPTTTDVQHEEWIEDVDITNTTRTESDHQAKANPEVANDEWNENATELNSFVPEKRRDSASQNNSSTTDTFHDHRNYKDRQERRNHRGGRNKGPPPGFGRGTRHNQNDQELYNEGSRQGSFQHNRGYGHQNNQNSQRFYPRHNEESWDNQRDSRQRDAYRKHDERHNRGQGYNYRQENDQHRHGDERENRSREKSYPQQNSERGNRFKDNKDGFQNNAYTRDGPNRETNELKDGKESSFQGQGAWRGKNHNTLNFGKDENKETSLVRGRQNQNQSQGSYSNNNNRRNQVKSEIPNILTECNNQDLFSVSDDFSLAHCVGQDFRMSSGIAVKFKEMFKKVGELLDQNVEVGGCAHLEESGRFIFYLVTKEISTGKPTLESLRKSLEAMKDKCLKFGVKKLAMPRIGCGLDKLDWSEVKVTINKVFRDAGMEEIRIYEFNVEGLPEGEGNRLDAKRNKLSVMFKEIKLVDMERGTALLFLGTENSYMDPTALTLNEKHRIEVEYKNAEKTVGKTVCCVNSPRNEYVYSLIVAKTQKDKVSFSKVEQCCGMLAQMLRKDEYKHVGIEFPQGWSNERIFFEKILTLLRNTLPKWIKLWVCFPKAEMDIFKWIKDSKDKENSK